MQSGITVSPELHTAFQALVSDPSQRGLLAIIKSESIVPTTTIPSSSSTTSSEKESFLSDLDHLQPHLTPTQPLYILLRTAPSKANTFVAITYTPTTSPVRQKMLFASTRLSLVRDLGAERFGSSIFVTEASELTREGWGKHEKGEEADAPLTREEETLKGVKDAEAVEAGRSGTGGRQLETGGKLALGMGDGVREALVGLKGANAGSVVVLGIDVSTEKIILSETRPQTQTLPTSSLSSLLPQSSPSYTFYQYLPPSPSSGPLKTSLIFIYTCPPTSKIKERMLYAASKRALITAAGQPDIGLQIVKSIEVGDAGDVNEGLFEEEFKGERHGGGTSGGGGGSGGGEGGGIAGQGKGFARPRRPGR